MQTMVVNKQLVQCPHKINIRLKAVLIGGMQCHSLIDSVHEDQVEADDRSSLEEHRSMTREAEITDDQHARLNELSHLSQKQL